MHRSRAGASRGDSLRPSGRGPRWQTWSFLRDLEDSSVSCLARWPIPSLKLVSKSKSQDLLALREFLRRFHPAHRLHLPPRITHSGSQRLKRVGGAISLVF